MLAPLTHSPKTILLAAAATGVAPTALRVNPFMGGNLVAASAQAVLTDGTPNTLATPALVGVSVNRNTAKKHLQLVVPAAAITTVAAGVVKVAGTWTGAQVTGDLTLTLGTADGQILDEIADCGTITDADLNLTTIVCVNGKPYGRIVDTASPAPAALQWGSSSSDGRTIVIGADSTYYIPVGAVIDIFIGLNVGKLAERDAAGTLIAGTALDVGAVEERYLGVISSYTDTAGRSVTGLVASDFVMAEVAPVSLVGVTL